jgi:NTP pyrophosphatase (non-canonical NTP hydrolase)
MEERKMTNETSHDFLVAGSSKVIDLNSTAVQCIVLNKLANDIYQHNVAAGWYTDLSTGLPFGPAGTASGRNIGEMLMLIVSEVAEGMEGYRKGLQDDKLPHRSMLEVELADAMIRIFDLAGYAGLDLGGAIAEKRAYNAQRADHKLETRQAGGKKF